MTNMSEPRIFNKFNDLPTELRELIWEMALPGPRVVNVVQRRLQTTFRDWVSANEDSFIDTPRDWYDGTLMILDENIFLDSHMVGYQAKSVPPQILFVCRESFGVATKHYHRAFSCIGSIPQTYFNFSIDILYLRYNTFAQSDPERNVWGFLANLQSSIVGLGDTETCQKVENLAIIMEVPHAPLMDFNGWLVRIFKVFPGLKRFNIVVEHYGKVKSAANPDSITLIDPIDVAKTLQVYCEFLPFNNCKLQLPAVLPHRKANSLYLLNVDWLERTMNLAGYSDWVVPEMDCKVAITDVILKELEGLQKKCEKIVDETNRALE